MSFEGLYNENEFYSEHYLHEILLSDLKETLAAWSKIDTDPVKGFGALRPAFLKMHQDLGRSKPRDPLKIAGTFRSKLINSIGYTTAEGWAAMDNMEVDIPVCFRAKGPDGKDLVMGLAVYPEDEEDTALDSRLRPEQYPADTAEARRVCGVPAEDILSDFLFRQDSPPRRVLLFAPDEIVLVDRGKWQEKRYLRFDLAEIYDYRNQATYGALCALLHRETLAPGAGGSLVDTLDENSHRHAFAVSEDLKFSLREAIELLGNHAVSVINASKIAEMKDGETLLTRELLRYMYRLLFLFYIEARPELGYAPMKSDIYASGYSLESLRDLADQPLPTSKDEQDSMFIDQSLQKLFSLVQSGFVPSGDEVYRNAFRMTPLQSHLFDPVNTPILNGIAFPNRVLHRVLELMSLNRPRSGRSRRGRISYVQLGINQLGAVYEGLLSYSGFVAGEDLFEVQRAEDAGNRTDLDQGLFVTRAELSNYRDVERVLDAENNFRTYPKGSFIFRLAGRNREKSASYYTPESLTRTVVTWALKELLAGVATHIKLTFNRTLICLADFVDGAIENGPSIEEGPLCCLKDFR
jgi:hypothetical protein